MKLASYHRSRGQKVKLVRGKQDIYNFNPDKIEITSLFSYAWKPVHEAIEYYHNLFPNAKIRIGGIYASLMPERIKSFYPFVDVHIGLFEEADKYLPAYDILKDVNKWKNWNSTILFTSRWCLRKCPFCMVPKIEGKIRTVIGNIEEQVFPDHKELILWDNNFFAAPEWKRVTLELKETGLSIDFNQGLDARLINDEKANILAELRIQSIRMAYDIPSEKESLIKAVDMLHNYGINKRKIFIYCLYNFYDDEGRIGDTPEDFFERIKFISDLGCVSYPMRYEPLLSLEKNKYISPLWTKDELEYVAKARRVIGFGGAFPPYKGLVNKLNNAQNFKEAFSLYPTN